MMFMQNPFENLSGRRTAAVIVAHPDDETLWSGGTILAHPDWAWLVVSLCRKSDPDRSSKFYQALTAIGAKGDMADLDDGPDQTPLAPGLVENACLGLLGEATFDMVVTHGPEGEYTRHRRHEEVSRAVSSLWLTGRLQAQHLVMFAFEDGGRDYSPCPRTDAHFDFQLESMIWEKKRSIITDIYGFSEDSWETQITPREEAFWSFESKKNLSRWLTGRGNEYEDSRSV